MIRINNQYWDNLFPRLSVQYKQFEIGGLYNYSHSREIPTDSSAIYLPDFDTIESSLKLFFRYHPIKLEGVNFELGLIQNKINSVSYDFMTKEVKNPVTEQFEMRNEQVDFDLDDNFQGINLGVGYSYNLVSELYLDAQLNYSIGYHNREDYIDRLLTSDASDLNKADINKHFFFFEERKHIHDFMNFNIGLTYKFGLR